VNPTARRRRWTAAVLAVALATGACSDRPLDTAPPTTEPATPAVSPAADSPAGTVRPLPLAGQAAVFDATTATPVVLGTTPDGRSALALPAGTPRTVPLPTAATALAVGGDGSVLAAVRGGYLRYDIAADRVETFAVDGHADTEFTAVTRRGDGRVVLGSADGAVLTLDAANRVAARTDGFVRIDALAAVGDVVVVLDRAQTSVTSLKPDGSGTALALRAGEGATTMTADPAGRVLVADTRGGELLVYGADPLMLRQRYPVPDAPYGLAGSAGLTWVSQTATNTVVGYDLSTGIPVQRVRHRTVQQPNALAFDAASGTLYVVSGTGAGVQVISDAAVQR